MANEAIDNQGAHRAGANLQRKGWYYLWYGGLGSLVLVGIVLAVSLAGSSSVNAAPNFPITLYQGDSELGAHNLDLADLRGKPVVLNFWAGLCPPCRAEMPDLQLFYEDFKDKVTLIGIDLGQYTGLGNQNDARSLLNLLGVTYPAGFTDDASVAQRYEVLAMPTTVFINSKGEVFKKWGGLLTLGVLTDVSNEMLALESGSPY
jgi:thiol-disulfide isomerase/thioredoxin